MLQRLAVDARRGELDRCVGSTLMSAFEAPENSLLWMADVELALAKLKPHDERIAPWAAALPHDGDSRRARFLKQLGSDPL